MEPLELEIAGNETEKEKEKNEKLKCLSLIYKHTMVKQVIYKGLLCNTSCTPSGLEAMVEFELQDGDVLVCGYPKSGTTWLQEVVYLIQNNADIACARSKPCYVRCPNLEDRRAQIKIIPYMTSPRVFKTHQYFHWMPKAASICKAKLIYIMRNPKDVVVSYFHFYQSLSELGNFEGSFEEFLRMFMDGYVVCGDWCMNVCSWWSQRKNPNILIVSFEEMKMNQREVIKTIADFCESSLKEEEILRIEENTTFDIMKDNPSTNFQSPALKKSFRLPFMRKGEVGDWKNYFTVAQEDKFDQHMIKKIGDKALLNSFIFE